MMADAPAGDEAASQTDASRAGADPAAAEQAGPGQQAPDFEEVLRQLGSTGRATLGAGGNTARAFRALLVADASLARSALGRTLAMTGVAIAFGASAWLLLMAALIVFLSRTLGLPWSTALLLTALLSVAATAASGWLAIRYFDHTRMHATRRQLARLGIGAPDAPDVGAASAGDEGMAGQGPAR